MIFPILLMKPPAIHRATWLRPGRPGHPRANLSVTDATDYADRMLYDITYNIV